jgi:hypothetical protein
MKWRWLLLVLVVVVVVVALGPAEALAAPGGKIASAVVKSFWGRVAMAALVLLFLPIIVYVLVREAIATRRAQRDLKKLRVLNPAFDWMALHDRVVECFTRVHAAWRKEDMAQASAWMTDWYWQNQQLAHLDRWAEQGLVNKCTVKSVGHVRPLHVACRSGEGDFSGSRVVLSVTANMEDYLQERATGKIVEGEIGYKDVEWVWTLELAAGVWRVARIEEGSLSLTYATMANELPVPMPQPSARRA